MTRPWIATGAFSAAAAVIVGAFGAHGLSGHLPAEMMDAYETGVQYHFYHSLGLIGIGVVQPVGKPSAMLAIAPWVMLTGVLLFSGSLYLLSITGIRSLGIITPVGGVALIVAWILLALSMLSQAKRAKR